MTNNDRLYAIDLAEEDELDDAAYFMGRALRSGNINALNDYGVILQRQGEYQSAKKCYEAAIDAGVALAYANLADLYVNGNVGPLNINDVISLYEKGASLGEPDCYEKLGNLYLFGKFVTKDIKKAFGLYQKGYIVEVESGRGYKNAIMLATGYTFNYFGIEDRIKEKEYYLFAAKRGCNLAYYNLGFMYLNEGNNEEAISYWLIAGEKNYPDGYFELAERYWHGTNGFSIDKQAAAHFLEKAIEEGSYKAYLMHLDLLLSGELGEVDIHSAEFILAKYLVQAPYKEDYQDYYDAIKAIHKDKIDFEAIEANPRNYYLTNGKIRWGHK